MFRTMIVGLIAVLAMAVCAQASDVMISQPTIGSGSVLSQTARVNDTANSRTIWYWCTDSPAEGTQFFRHIGDTMPALNDNNPAWQAIDGFYYVDDLCEWGPYGGPSTSAERAYLTDVAAYTLMGDSFESAYWYVCWTDSLEDLQALSVLYPE